MTLDRRDFLRSTCVVGGGLALGGSSALGASPIRADGVPIPDISAQSVGRAASAKRLLILGGTGFIGPSMVRYAVERGHEVTIFTRGQSKADIPDVEHLIGDRNDEFHGICGEMSES